MSIKKYIPDTITSLNLLCGVLGIVAVFQGYFQQAFLLMLLAAVFDFFDGFAARALDAYSDLGKELDSLSDVVSFGVLPSLMLFCYMSASHGGVMGVGPWWVRLLCLLPLSIAVFSGLRLAKFNVDTRQSSSFLGLPTPACAILCGAMVCFASVSPCQFVGNICSSLWFIPLVSVILSALLVCDLPMFSLKFHKGDNLRSAEYVKRYILLAALLVTVVVAAVCRLHWSFVPLALLKFYVLENIVAAIVRK